MTFVFLVILLSIKLGSILKVLGSISTITGFKPNKSITSIVDANEKLVVITSSPLLRSNAISAI